MTMASDDIRARVASVLPGVRKDLEDLVRIQSVSADPERLGEVERSAEATVALFRAEGVDARIVRAYDGAPPAVIGEKRGPEGAPVVLLYAHHDVQPENDPAEWDSPPWEPTERGDRLYGRGAADDKAGIMAHVAALRVLGDDLPVTVRLFIEGEEEVASATLPQLLEQNLDELRADVIVIADSGNWDIGVPALTTSLRGLVRVNVEVRTLTHAVHQGMWGGLVPDAVITLSRLIASLHDDDGNLLVEGLVSGPAADVDYPEERLRAESGVGPGVEWIGSGPEGRAAVDPARALRHRPRRPQGRRLLQHPDPGRPGPARAAHRPRRDLEERDRLPERSTSRSTSPGAPSSRSRSSTPASRSRSTSPARPTTPPVRRSPRRGTAPSRSTWASAARSRSSPSSSTRCRTRACS